MDWEVIRSFDRALGRPKTKFQIPIQSPTVKGYWSWFDRLNPYEQAFIYRYMSLSTATKRIRTGSGLEGRLMRVLLVIEQVIEQERLVVIGSITGRNGISNQTVVVVTGGKLLYHYVIIRSLIVSLFRVILPLHCRRMRETSNWFFYRFLDPSKSFHCDLIDIVFSWPTHLIRLSLCLCPSRDVAY